MPWLATLDLRYTLDAQGHTISQEQHSGPMRVLQRLYPEGPALAQHVLLHPPGDLVAGDSLTLNVRLAAQSQALITMIAQTHQRLERLALRARAPTWCSTAT